MVVVCAIFIRVACSSGVWHVYSCICVYNPLVAVVDYSDSYYYYILSHTQAYKILLHQQQFNHFVLSSWTHYDVLRQHKVLFVHQLL